MGRGSGGGGVSGRGGGGGGRAGRGGAGGGGASGATTEQPAANVGVRPPKISGDPDEVLEVRFRGASQVEITREIAAAEDAAMNKRNLQTLAAYDNLPPVENANRVVRDGFVHVGDRGAPVVTPRLTNDQAMRKFEQMGMPRGEAWDNIRSSGDAAALIELFPAGSKYLGEGVEGVGFKLPGTKIALRIQHGGGKPLLQPDVGKVGVYAEWMGKYGNTWVEAKEAVALQGKFIGASRNRMIGPISAKDLKKGMEANMARELKRVHGVDDHGGNWGIDYTGRARVFDAGAYRPIGDRRVAAIWDGSEAVQSVFTYTNKVRRP